MALIRLLDEAGNLYVNRDFIGVQPFGGKGYLRPTAGRQNYLRAFTSEQPCTVNIAAAGGDAALLSRAK